MSTTTEKRIAMKYARSKSGKVGVILKIKPASYLQLGIDLTHLSCFVEEAEYLYPPGTLLTPLGRNSETIYYNDEKYVVIEVHAEFPSL